MRENFTDNFIISQRKVFKKTWFFSCEEGSKDLPKGTSLVHVGGDKLEEDTNASLKNKRALEKSVAPGETFDLSLYLVSPFESEHYCANYRL